MNTADKPVGIIAVFIFIMAGVILLTPYIVISVGNYQDPTFAEMATFVFTDNVNFNRYTDDYVCAHFSRDLISNARAKGYRAGYVIIESTGADHAIVAFDTSNLGLYFVEPQTDYIFSESEMNEMINEGFYKNIFLDNREPYMDISSYDINWYKLWW